MRHHAGTHTSEGATTCVMAISSWSHKFITFVVFIKTHTIAFDKTFAINTKIAMTNHNAWVLSIMRERIRVMVRQPCVMAISSHTILYKIAYVMVNPITQGLRTVGVWQPHRQYLDRHGSVNHVRRSILDVCDAWSVLVVHVTPLIVSREKIKQGMHSTLPRKWLP